MKQKIILSIAILSLLSLAVFVSATMTISNSAENVKAYNVEIPVVKGWNLIASGFTFASDLRYLDETGDIKYDNIKAVYVYSNKINEYLASFPEYDQRLYSANDYFNGDEQDIIGQANWIYVDKAGTLKYQTKAIKIIDSTNLFSGWNFLSLTPEYDGKSFNDIKGTCQIENIYGYDTHELSGGASWDLIAQDETLSSAVAGKGIIIKVTNNCKLGSGSNSVGDIPQLPN